MVHRWHDTNDQVQQWQESLADTDTLYLDTEFMRERTFWPQLALVQVHDGRSIRLIDAPQISPSTLAPVFRDHTLVMHACSEDLEAIAAHGGVYPQRIEDTQIAAALCGDSMQLSYQRLVQQVLGVELPKGATRTNWLKRPLSEEQLHYAVDDVKYLPELVQILRARLQTLGRQDWWQEECQRLLAQARHEPEPENAWRHVKGASQLAGPSLSVLAALAPWRDATARRRNLPKGFVIKDAQLLDLARSKRTDRSALSQAGLHPKAIRRDGDALLALMADAQQNTPPEPLPGPPDAQQKKRVKQLRSRVAEIATSLQLQPDVLMRRRWLEALIRQPEQMPEPLSGWRYELVARPLLALL